MAEEVLTCQTCGKEWSRISIRGRKPKLCDDCKADPLQIKKQKELSNEAKVEAAKVRIDNLETSLKSRGNHLSQPRERRSYVLSDLDERIHKLEEWRDSLEEKADSPIPKGKSVHKRSGGKRTG